MAKTRWLEDRPPATSQRIGWMREVTMFSLEREVRKWKLIFALCTPLFVLVALLVGIWIGGRL